MNSIDRAVAVGVKHAGHGGVRGRNEHCTSQLTSVVRRELTSVSKMVDRFTDSQMLKLVQTYENYPCLWNVRNVKYRDQCARDKAYQAIWQVLNIPGISAKDIPKKIKNMRSSYYQELKRIEKSIRSGADTTSVYKPKVSWFDKADAYLKKCRNRRIKQDLSNLGENSNTTSDNESEPRIMEYSNNEDDSDAVDDTKEGIEYIFCVEDDNNETDAVETNQNEISSSVFSAPCEEIKSFKNMETINNNDNIHTAIDRLDKIAKNINSTTNSITENREDEFDVFGKYIATTLRSLPGELAIMAKTDLQKTLSEVQLRALRQSNQPTRLSYGTSTFNA